MNSRTLTLVRLEQLHACEPARVDFQRVFGSQVDVTPERFAQPDVIEENFDFDWAVDSLLPPDKRDEFYNELKSRREKLKQERGYTLSVQITREDRAKLVAVLWAEFYVAHGLDAGAPTPTAPCGEVESLDEDDDDLEEDGEDFEDDNDENDEREVTHGH